MVLSISSIAILTSYLGTLALLLTARPALFEIFLIVEGAGHRWVSLTWWAILITICNWDATLIAFRFLWSLRRLRDSRALLMLKYITPIRNFHIKDQSYGLKGLADCSFSFSISQRPWSRGSHNYYYYVIIIIFSFLHQKLVCKVFENSFWFIDDSCQMILKPMKKKQSTLLLTWLLCFVLIKAFKTAINFSIIFSRPAHRTIAQFLLIF